MRLLIAFALLTTAIPAAATAGNTAGHGIEQTQRTDPRNGRTACATRDKDRAPREIANRNDCRVTKPVPPVVDPTPVFLI